MIATHRLVQQNSGMRMKCMPGARLLKMVTAKFMPVSVDPMPEIRIAHSQ